MERRVVRLLTLVAIATMACVGAAVALAALSKPSALQLQLTDAHVGYVRVRVHGPAGATVTLSEQRGSRTVKLDSFSLPASGTHIDPQAAIWLCTQRTQTIMASATVPAGTGTGTSTAGSVGGATALDTASASIVTPSCAHRLAVTAAASGTVGASATILLRDRWHVGQVVATVCATPPGGRRGCHAVGLRPGQAARADKVALLRPGGWTISASVPGGHLAVKQVWAAHPSGRIVLYAAGDSEMQILDDDIAQDLGPHHVSVSSDARISTGLTNAFLFNWQNEARARAASLKPDVSVVFMGANDGFSTPGPGGVRFSCCGAAWAGGYANEVAEMMGTLLRGTAGRVYWFLLPTPRPANFQSLFDGVNLGIREAAKRFPGRVVLINANAYFTPGNQYRDFMVVDGHGFTIHESDGIHLSAAADVYAAQLLVDRMRADHVIR